MQKRSLIIDAKVKGSKTFCLNTKSFISRPKLIFVLEAPRHQVVVLQDITVPASQIKNSSLYKNSTRNPIVKALPLISCLSSAQSDQPWSVSYADKLGIII